jgi:hypothetical protein
MHPEYYDVYRDLLDTYRVAARRFVLPAAPGFIHPRVQVETVIEAVDAAASELALADRLRPDARYFLVINLYQMIALPFEHPDAPTRPHDIVRELRADAKAILGEARGDAGTGEVTGHDVASAVPKVWQQLRTAKWELWG